MNKIVNGVANDYEFDMFPPNVEKIIMTKDNYKRLFNNLQEENMILKDRIDKAIEYIENDLQSFLYSAEYKTLLDILKGSDNND